jgi:hypothetical protein
MENVNRMMPSTDGPNICLYEAEELHKTEQEFGREADMEGLYWYRLLRRGQNTLRPVINSGGI